MTELKQETLGVGGEGEWYILYGKLYSKLLYCIGKELGGGRRGTLGEGKRSCRPTFTWKEGLQNALRNATAVAEAVAVEQT